LVIGRAFFQNIERKRGLAKGKKKVEPTLSAGSTLPLAF
jgi:hypothetical protein